MKLLCCVILCLVCLCGKLDSASAAVEIGAQDDQAVVYQWWPRAAALATFKQLHVTTVRVNIVHNPGTGPTTDPDGLMSYTNSAMYLDAFKTLKANGFRVAATLKWQGTADIPAYKLWVAKMVATFAPYVDRWSIMNEPELELPRPTGTCAPIVTKRILSSTGLVAHSVIDHHKGVRLRRFYLKGRRVRHLSNHRRHNGPRWYVRRQHHPRHKIWLKRKWVHGHYQIGWRYYRRRYMAWTSSHIVYSTIVRHTVVKSVSMRKACDLYQLGKTYRAILDATIPVVRSIDPSAEVHGGEDSSSWNTKTFLQSVFEAGQPSVDGWDFHPYDFGSGSWGMNYLNDVAGFFKSEHMPLYFTEYGRFGFDAAAALHLAWAWQTALSCGCTHEMLMYQLYGPRWATSHWNTATMTDPSDVGSLKLKALMTVLG